MFPLGTDSKRGVRLLFVRQGIASRPPRTNVRSGRGIPSKSLTQFARGIYVSRRDFDFGPTPASRAPLFKMLARADPNTNMRRAVSRSLSQNGIHATNQGMSHLCSRIRGF